MEHYESEEKIGGQRRIRPPSPPPFRNKKATDPVSPARENPPPPVYQSAVLAPDGSLNLSPTGTVSHRPCQARRWSSHSTHVGT